MHAQEKKEITQDILSSRKSVFITWILSRIPLNIGILQSEMYRDETTLMQKKGVSNVNDRRNYPLGMTISNLSDHTTSREKGIIFQKSDKFFSLFDTT